MHTLAHQLPRMRKPVFSLQQEAPRHPNTARSGLNNSNNSSTSAASSSTSASAAISAWVYPRLLDTTARLLALHPDDPLQVLSAHFATEALLLAAYPETPTLTDEKELKGVVDASLRASPSSPGLSGKSIIGLGSKGRASLSSGSGDTPAGTSAAIHQIALGYLVEYSWARRQLQPYGLHALARCVCPSLQHCTEASNPAVASAETVAAAQKQEQQQQWMECFALLHRQSRLTASEKAVAARRAAQVNGTAIPPVDYRAAEEVPVSLVFLYVMCVIEAHVRRVGGGAEVGDSPHAVCIFLRLRLAVKLLGLQLLASTMDCQEYEKSDRYSTSNSTNDEEEHTKSGVGNEEREDNQSTGASPSDSLLQLLFSLPLPQLEKFYLWFLQRECEMSICPSSSLVQNELVLPKTSTQVSPLESASPSINSPNVEMPAPLLELQPRVIEIMRSVFSGDSGALSAAPVLMTVEVFVTLMQRLTVMLVMLQGTAVSMAVTLSVRVGRAPCRPYKSNADAWRWMRTLLGKCTNCLMYAMAPSIKDASEPQLLPVWKMYVGQITNALCVFQNDVALLNESNGKSKTKRVKLALSKVADEVFSNEEPYVTSLFLAFKDVPSSVVITALVSGWMLRVFEAHISTLTDCQ